MKTRTYRGATMRDALGRVRRDLGSEAVIHETREVERRTFWRWGRRLVVEVVASRGLPAPHLSVGPTIRGKGTGVADSQAAPSGLRRDLRDVHAAVETLSRQGVLDHLLPQLPAGLVPAYGGLLEAGVTEPLASRIISHLADSLEYHEIEDVALAAEALRRTIEGLLPIAPPIAVVPGVRRTVALIGPTGVGKTTTVAKLAANFKLVQNVRVGLVTVDTYRIAAIEQLRTYAEIIGLPLMVVNTASEMPAAIEALGAVDLVLIDTAGRSPRDEVRIRELAAFLEAASPDEVHLVLSATATERGLRATVERFSQARTDRLILTKLDEAEMLGSILGVLTSAGRPISYLTTGQGVPDDIEPADRSRLARLILGDEVVG